MNNQPSTSGGGSQGNGDAGLGDDTNEIIRRLNERSALMDSAMSKVRLNEGAGVVLQTRATQGEVNGAKKLLDVSVEEALTASDVTEAVNYRLAITDLFVEKAQFHLERRADRYEYLGFAMYVIAVILLAGGAFFAVYRMLRHDEVTHPNVAAKPAVEASAKTSSVTPAQGVAVSAGPPVASSTQLWIDLILRFVLAFTGYGFIVLTAVALARGARACLDQRERLLAKRHSLRQGRLYLHLTGGHVTIEEMERAFNWNHEQHNAFTHMPTDTKAPWGAVIEEVVKVTPELVKAGVALAREASEKDKKSAKEDGKKG